MMLLKVRVQFSYNTLVGKPNKLPWGAFPFRCEKAMG